MVKTGDMVKILSQFLPSKQKYIGEIGTVTYVSQYVTDAIDITMNDGDIVSCTNASEYAIINEEVI